MKKCSCCFEVKPFSEFYKNKRKKDGYASLCKVCATAFVAEWKLKNPEKITEYVSAHRAAHLKNPEKERARQAKYRKENPEKIKASQARSQAKYKVSDDYAKKLISAAVNTKEIPQELIELKKAQLQMQRDIKNMIIKLNLEG